MRLFAVAALAALTLPAAAPAVVFQSTYTPSTATPTYQYTHLPLDYRTAGTGFSRDNPGSSSGYCANLFCTYVQGDQTATEFVASGNYTASHIVVPLISYHYQYQRGIGFNVAKWNATTSAWDGLGFAALDTNYIPRNQDIEVRLAFGQNSTYEYEHFAYQPISFQQGERYMIYTNGAFGGIGYLTWYASDLAAAPGQTQMHSTLIPSHQYLGSVNLPQQMAWALTDGGDLNVGTVPEPASWAMLIGGFGLAGYAARRRRLRRVLAST